MRNKIPSFPHPSLSKKTATTSSWAEWEQEKERDATNHPGKESFHGEISRFLIFDRPLSDPELKQMIQHFTKNYLIKTNP